MVIIWATSLWTLRSDSLLTLSQILQVTAKAGLEEVVCFPPPGRPTWLDTAAVVCSTTMA